MNKVCLGVFFRLRTLGFGQGYSHGLRLGGRGLHEARRDGRSLIISTLWVLCNKDRVVDIVGSPRDNLLHSEESRRLWHAQRYSRILLHSPYTALVWTHYSKRRLDDLERRGQGDTTWFSVLKDRMYTYLRNNDILK